MCQPEKDKLPEKEKDEPQKKDVSFNNTEVAKTNGKKMMEFHDPSTYYLKD